MECLHIRRWGTNLGTIRLNEDKMERQPEIDTRTLTRAPSEPIRPYDRKLSMIDRIKENGVMRYELTVRAKGNRVRSRSSNTLLVHVYEDHPAFPLLEEIFAPFLVELEQKYQTQKSDGG